MPHTTAVARSEIMARSAVAKEHPQTTNDCPLRFQVRVSQKALIQRRLNIDASSSASLNLPHPLQVILISFRKKTTHFPEFRSETSTQDFRGQLEHSEVFENDVYINLHANSSSAHIQASWACVTISPDMLSFKLGVC